jgi:hypothetical protein
MVGLACVCRFAEVNKAKLEEEAKQQAETVQTASVTPSQYPLYIEVSRGSTERTYSMKPYIWRVCKEYGDKHGVPKEVWYPIIMMESNGKPTSTTITKKEDSRGLLQINTRVHKVDKTKVYDPEYNLSYQMPELADKYKEAKVKGLKGLDVVYYVERYGQRCEWTQTVRDLLKKYYNEIMEDAK